MEYIFTIFIISTRQYSTAVFGILHGAAHHIADNAADIVSAGNVHAVVNSFNIFNRFVINYRRITNSRV